MRISSGDAAITSQASYAGSSWVDFRPDYMRRPIDDKDKKAVESASTAKPRHGITLETLPRVRNADFDQVRTLLGELFGINLGRPAALQNLFDRTEKINGDGDQPLTDSEGALLHRTREYLRETVDVSAPGSVTTADGRVIDFKLDLRMHQEAARELAHIAPTWHQGSSSYKDGIVLDLGGEPARYSADSSSTVGKGFLAHDADGNGTVTDDEVLDARELAKFDDDGNGWIDEGDSIWRELVVTTNGRTGASKSLCEAGVGALSLRVAASTFTLLGRGEYNDAGGKILATGMALTEQGKAVAMYHVSMYA